MIEAYHASENPEEHYAQVEALYDVFWKPKIEEQIAAYMLRIPMTNHTQTIELQHNLGHMNSMVVSEKEDRFYFVSQDGTLVTTDVQGADYKSTNGDFFMQEQTYSVPILFQHGSNIYSGGMSKSGSTHVQIDQRNQDLTSTGKSVSSPSQPAGEFAHVRGFSVDTASDTLYMAITAYDGNTPLHTNITAINLEDLSYDWSKSFMLQADRERIGPIQVIDGTGFAVVVTDTYPFSAQAAIVDLAAKEIIHTFTDTSVHPWYQPDGDLEVEVRWPSQYYERGVVYVDVTHRDHPLGVKVDHHALVIPFGHGPETPRSAVSTGNIAYSAGYGAANYTLVEGTDTFVVPMPYSKSGGAVAMNHDGSSLYQYVAPNKVVVSEYSYPEENPPPINGIQQAPASMEGPV